MNTLSDAQKKIVEIQNADAFFAEIGLKNLPEDKKANMLSAATQSIMNRIALRIEPFISKEDDTLLAKLEEQEDADNEIFRFLSNKIPDLDKIAREEVENYKKEIKSQIATILELIKKEDKNR